MNSLTDDDLRARLAAADPWSEPDLGDVLAPLVARHVTSADHGVTALRGRRRPWVVAGVGAAAALALTAAGVASGAWTGDRAGGTSDGRALDDSGRPLTTADGDPVEDAWGTDTSELVDLEHPGAAAVVASLAPRDRPLPPWLTWDDVVARATSGLGADAGVASADGVRAGMVGIAAAAWQTAWFEARAAGDQAAADRALDEWAGALAATEPVWAPESWQRVQGLVQDVRAGDSEAMLRDLEIGAPDDFLDRIGVDGDPATSDLPGPDAPSVGS